MITALIAACLVGRSSAYIPRLDLTAWRQADKNGRSCASCHSPDGIELAVFGYGRQDLLRRAGNHLPMSGQEAVLKMILNRRKTLSVANLNPLASRPLQPGAVTLPGKTAEARDAEFVSSLRKLAPKLMGPKVSSLKDAQAVREEILGIDLSRLPVGITMNRLSEDGFHGSEHASLAHWIPDVPIPTSPKFWEAEDKYLASPSYATLQELDNVVREQFKPKTPIEELALAKYRSLLQLQHQLRIEQKQALAEPLPRPLFGDNPMWQIAEIGRVYAMSDGTVLGLPADVAAAKTKGVSLEQQMRELRLPWYWLGWIADPSLTHSGPQRETLRADYFSQTLLHEGPYPAHATFMLLRKLCEQSRNENTRTRPWEIQFSFLLLDRQFVEWEPKNPSDKANFRRMCMNAFLSCLYLLQADLAEKHAAVFPESQQLQVKRISEYLAAIQQSEPALVSNVLQSLKAARRYR